MLSRIASIGSEDFKESNLQHLPIPLLLHACITHKRPAFCHYFLFFFSVRKLYISSTFLDMRKCLIFALLKLILVMITGWQVVYCFRLVLLLCCICEGPSYVVFSKVTYIISRTSLSVSSFFQIRWVEVQLKLRVRASSELGLLFYHN